MAIALVLYFFADSLAKLFAYEAPMSFFTKITNTENSFLKDIKRVTANGDQIVLYGANMLASRIYSFLNNNAVAVDFIAVDDAYMHQKKYFYSKEITSIESLQTTGNKYSYIIGFEPRNIPLLYEKLSNTASNILLYDVGYGAPENQADIIYYSDGFIQKNKTEIEKVASYLEDDFSKDTLANFINQRISGEIGCYKKSYRPDQYFPDDIITLPHGSVYIDCGAYTGDTIDSFVNKLKKDGISGYSHIYAFEPNMHNFTALQNKTQTLADCTAINKGVWNGPSTLHFAYDAMGSAISDAGKAQIDVDSIDNILLGEKATFIKMDIEGAELQALHGAKKTIQKYKPTLAICIYHKAIDIVSIPLFVKSLVPEYKLFIRAHSLPVTRELVLYCVP